MGHQRAQDSEMIKSEPKETTPYGPLLAQPEEANLLADRLRPRTLDEFVGQSHLTGLFSGDGELTTENIIFWGPPG
jgi:hypothetical protein